MKICKGQDVGALNMPDGILQIRRFMQLKEIEGNE